MVFERLAEYGLALALPKCSFAREEVQFLGYKISKAGITPLSNKIQSITDFPQPTTQKQQVPGDAEFLQENPAKLRM